MDLTGKRFGRLIVVERKGSNKWGKKLWLCKCDCGNKITAITSHLNNGNTRSCGCLQREMIGNVNRLPKGISNMRGRIRSYKARAQKKGLEYSLTEKQFKEISQQNCYYCGSEPSNTTGNYTYNGLDRIDNTMGYTINNVVPCCMTCNSAKGKLTVEEFKDWITKAYNKLREE